MNRSLLLLAALIVSCGLVVAGVALLSVPAALIVAGLCGAGLSLLFVEVGGDS